MFFLIECVFTWGVLLFQKSTPDVMLHVTVFPFGIVTFTCGSILVLLNVLFPQVLRKFI